MGYPPAQGTGGGGGVASLNGLTGALNLSTPNSTLQIGTSGSNITLDLNLANANTWTGAQTFMNVTILGTQSSAVFAVQSINATSTTTTVNSPNFQQFGSYWNTTLGAVSVGYNAQVSPYTNGLWGLYVTDFQNGNIFWAYDETNTSTTPLYQLYNPNTGNQILGIYNVTSGNFPGLYINTPTNIPTTGFFLQLGGSTSVQFHLPGGNGELVFWGGGASEFAVSFLTGSILGNSAWSGLTVTSTQSGHTGGIAIVPGSSALTSHLWIISGASAANATNYSALHLQSVGATHAIESLVGGTGTLKPIQFNIAGTTVMTLTTSKTLALLSGFQYNVTTVTASTTLTATNQVVLVNASSGAATITLPAASSGSGLLIIVAKIDSSANAVTVSRAGTDTIQGAVSQTLSTQYSKSILMSDGTSIWYDLGAGLV
jgi:hypothetical protein